MNIADLEKSLSSDSLKSEMAGLMAKLYPICRSITGNGFRESLNIIDDYVSLSVVEVPTGTDVYDWKVPKEWNIKDAYVKNSKGKRVIDFQKSNLHVVGYSVPVHKTVPLSELKQHLITLPEHPDWIPYRTSYYKEHWGFCMSYNEMMQLEEDDYEVHIDSELKEGHLTYGECYLKGQTSKEILLSCHACHPSLCNDNVSGMVLVALIGKYLSSINNYYSIRIIIIPATIGAITWLAMNEEHVTKIKHGLVVSCVGDPGKTTYKRSRIGNAEIDRAVVHVLKHSGDEYHIMNFSPYGYDERQFCSPGFNLPVGSLQRTSYGRYPEYHTSADNCDFVRPEYLYDSFKKYLSVINVLENNRTYLNTNPKGEPQLGKRGLYGSMGGQSDKIIDQMAILWVLNYSDGTHTLLDIAEKSCMEFCLISDAANVLIKKRLIVESEETR
ncbi:DUF4910 domain-containing protein [uncultured Candidatus Kuenenia sp.]|uniref:DUF4910 domain-containing protein n=1 Tax=uncultured Candidatus Kuenenia sp. TaxID=1048336 RepID=UPI0002FB37B4|nr:DUF4910 domain-containing protein [uncultured Candidatus Kuenenia sp.]